MRFIVTVVAAATLAWLCFIHPVQGRSVAGHLGEVWRLPEVQHKASLMRAEIVALGSRLAGGMAQLGAAHDSDRLDASDRQGLEHIIRRAEAEQPAEPAR